MHIKNTLTIIALSALGICIFLSLAKQSKMSPKSKDTMDKLGGILLFIAISLLAVSQLLKETNSGFELGVGHGYEYDHPYSHRDHHKPPHKHHDHPHHNPHHKPHHKPNELSLICSGPTGTPENKLQELLVLSASSWCTYCKKMEAQVEEMREGLAALNITLRYISDKECPKEFTKLKKEYPCDGFPCSFVLHGGVVKDKISGYMPADKLAAKAASLL